MDENPYQSPKPTSWRAAAWRGAMSGAKAGAVTALIACSGLFAILVYYHGQRGLDLGFCVNVVAIALAAFAGPGALLGAIVSGVSAYFGQRYDPSDPPYFH